MAAHPRLLPVLLLSLGAAVATSEAAAAAVKKIDPAVGCSAALLFGTGLNLTIPGLPYSGDRAAWTLKMQAARAACRTGFDASVYDRDDLRWTQTNYISPQMHPFGLPLCRGGKGGWTGRLAWGGSYLCVLS